MILVEFVSHSSANQDIASGGQIDGVTFISLLFVFILIYYSFYRNV